MRITGRAGAFTTCMASALLTAGLTAGTATAQPSLSASYDFKTLDFPGSFFSFPLGINNHREIAGSYEDGSGNHGYRWKNGKFTIIDFPGAMQFPSV